ncbi:hypothetical protein ACA910_000736 [Epithemia clementina (nom. ined.)]
MRYNGERLQTTADKPRSSLSTARIGCVVASTIIFKLLLSLSFLPSERSFIAATRPLVAFFAAAAWVPTRKFSVLPRRLNYDDVRHERKSNANQPFFSLTVALQTNHDGKVSPVHLKHQIRNSVPSCLHAAFGSESASGKKDNNTNTSAYYHLDLAAVGNTSDLFFLSNAGSQSKRRYEAGDQEESLFEASFNPQELSGRNRIARRRIHDRGSPFPAVEDKLDIFDDNYESGRKAPRSRSLPVLTTDSPSHLYLRNELGLSDEDLQQIRRWAPSALGMTAATLRHKMDVLSQSLQIVDVAQQRSLIQKAPALLHLSADHNVAPTINLLQQLLQLQDDEKDYLQSLVLACPSILGYSKATLKAKVSFFTSAKIMGLSFAETRSLLLKEPRLLRCSVRSGLVPHFRFLRRELNLSRESIRRIVTKNPRMLLYSLEDNLVPKLVFFGIMTLHMDTSHVERLLLSYPQFLDYNLERHTLPIARYFLHDLEFSPTEFRSIVLAYPRITTHSLSTIKHTAGWLRYNELNFTGAQVKRILFQAPQACALKDSNLWSKIHFLKQALGLEDDDNDGANEDLKKILVGMPRLLVLNVDQNLKPKVLFLREAFQGNLEVLRAAVVRLPALLGYSLEGRIRPRMESILRHGLPPSSITVGIPMRQDKFESWLEARSSFISSGGSSKSTGSGRGGKNQSSAMTSPQVETALTSQRTLENNGLGRVFHWNRERRKK